MARRASTRAVLLLLGLTPFILGLSAVVSFTVGAQGRTPPPGPLLEPGPVPDLEILFSSDVQGYYQPCG